jgi:thiol-disulfide isomerase/thioredoxin
MKKILSLILVLALTVLPLTAASAKTAEGPMRDGDAVGMDISGFSTTDFDGNPVTGEIFSQNTLTVVNFWATWCGPCRNELPEFDAASREYEGKVQFLIMDLADGVSESMETAVAFVEKNGYSFPVCFDTSLEGMKAYGISAIPVTVFIDADGNIASQSIGSMSGETLRKGIELIYQE